MSFEIETRSSLAVGDDLCPVHTEFTFAQEHWCCGMPCVWMMTFHRFSVRCLRLVCTWCVCGTRMRWCDGKFAHHHCSSGRAFLFVWSGVVSCRFTLLCRVRFSLRIYHGKTINFNMIVFTSVRGGMGQTGSRIDGWILLHHHADTSFSIEIPVGCFACHC